MIPAPTRAADGQARTRGQRCGLPPPCRRDGEGDGVADADPVDDDPPVDGDGDADACAGARGAARCECPEGCDVGAAAGDAGGAAAAVAGDAGEGAAAGDDVPGAWPAAIGVRGRGELTVAPPVAPPAVTADCTSEEDASATPRAVGPSVRGSARPAGDADRWASGTTTDPPLCARGSPGASGENVPSAPIATTASAATSTDIAPAASVDTASRPARVDFTIWLPGIRGFRRKCRQVPAPTRYAVRWALPPRRRVNRRRPPAPRRDVAGLRPVPGAPTTRTGAGIRSGR
jgi:hypothetical protein